MKHFIRIFLPLCLLLLCAAALACGEEPAPTAPNEEVCAHAETELRGATAATCQQEGYSGDTVCTACDTVVNVGTRAKKIDCEYVETGVIVAAPTCEQSGNMQRQCTMCGRIGVPAPIEKLGHALRCGDAVEDTANGLSTDLRHTYSCTRAGCNYSYTALHDGAVGTVPPTCYQTGYKYGTCTVCGVNYRAPDPSVPATGAHNWDEGELMGTVLVKRCQNEGCTATLRESLTPTPPAGGEGGSAGPEPADRIDDAENLYLSMTKIADVKPFTDNNGVYCRIMQGACTDGTYYYVVINDGYSSNADSISCIRKYNLATGELVATFENLHIAHANDLCYNPVTNEIIAVHNNPVRQLISILDADSLEFKRQVTLDLEIYAMAYDPFENCYWVGISYGYNFAKLDTDFKQIGNEYSGVETGYTKQGMDCDSKYVYFVQWDVNCILVYDKQGDFVKRIDLPAVTEPEPENIFHIGDVFYVGYNSGAGGAMYKVVLNAPKPPEISVSVQELTELPRYTDGAGTLFKMAQGSCSDGTYIYLAMNTNTEGDYRSVIYEIDPQTGAILATFEGINTGLTNDLTYNSITNEIAVIHNKPGARKISILDPATLTEKRVITLSFDVFSIAFDPTTGDYLLGISGGYNIARVSGEDLDQRIATYAGVNTGSTKQGMDCDGTYIYCVQSTSNNLAIYTVDGTYVGSYALPEGVGTAQSICHVGNTFYIGYDNSSAGGMLYAVTVTVE